MEIARGGLWRLRPAQHGTQGRLMHRLAQRCVGPELFHERGWVLLLPPQCLDQPLGLGPQGRGLAVRLIAHAQRLGVPQPHAAVAGTGDERFAVGAEDQRPDIAGVAGQVRHLLAARCVGQSILPIPISSPATPLNSSKKSSLRNSQSNFLSFTNTTKYLWAYPATGFVGIRLYFLAFSFPLPTSASASPRRRASAWRSQ